MLRTLPTALMLAATGCTGLDALPSGTDSAPEDSAQASADSGADSEDTAPVDTTPPPADDDGDGFTSDVDCNDADVDVFPGSTHRVDGQDSNCNDRLEWHVQFFLAVDDIGTLCVDDENNILLPEDGTWKVARSAEAWLESGAHTVGIHGRDTGRVITAATAHIEGAGSVWVTDGTWTYDPNPTFQDSTRSGWCSPSFDDTNWKGANVIGPILTTSPWTNHPTGFPAGSPAQWIWDHYPVELNTQYLRRTIQLP